MYEINSFDFFLYVLVNDITEPVGSLAMRREVLVVLEGQIRRMVERVQRKISTPGTRP